MAPQRGTAGKKAPKTTTTAKKKTAGNPFERLGNKRPTRPAALNARVKGAVRDVGRARLRGAERRKAGLLADLARERRENELDDRRLGEKANQELDEEEKFLLRFQREAKRRRVSPKGANAEDALTHGGAPLGAALTDVPESALHDGVASSSKKDDFDPTTQSPASWLEETKRRQEAQKEEARRGAEAVEKMDAEFGELQGLLTFRDTARKSFEPADEYDRTLRTLAAERRALPADAAMSPEEAARRAYDALDRAGRLVKASDCPRDAQTLAAFLSENTASSGEASSALGEALERLRVSFSPRLPADVARKDDDGDDAFADLCAALVDLLVSFEAAAADGSLSRPTNKPGGFFFKTPSASDSSSTTHHRRRAWVEASASAIVRFAREGPRQMVDALSAGVDRVFAFDPESEIY